MRMFYPLVYPRKVKNATIHKKLKENQTHLHIIVPTHICFSNALFAFKAYINLSKHRKKIKIKNNLTNNFAFLLKKYSDPTLCILGR